MQISELSAEKTRDMWKSIVKVDILNLCEQQLTSKSHMSHNHDGKTPLDKMPLLC